MEVNWLEAGGGHEGGGRLGGGAPLINTHMVDLLPSSAAAFTFYMYTVIPSKGDPVTHSHTATIISSPGPCSPRTYGNPVLCAVLSIKPLEKGVG